MWEAGRSSISSDTEKPGVSGIVERTVCAMNGVCHSGFEVPIMRPSQDMPKKEKSKKENRDSKKHVWEAGDKALAHNLKHNQYLNNKMCIIDEVRYNFYKNKNDFSKMFCNIFDVKYIHICYFLLFFIKK